MTINDPAVSNGIISFELSSVDTALNNWYVFKTSDTASITGTDPTTITNYLDKYYPLEVTASSTDEFAFEDLPYVAGELSLFLLDDTGWTRKDFVLANTKRTTGINFPVEINTSAVKQPTPLMSSNNIKGAPKYYNKFQEFLYMPREHMVPNITAYVFDEETNTIKQFVLNRNGQDKGNGTFGQIGDSDISSLPFPMLKTDITDTRSYRRFWALIAESEQVEPVSGVIRYYAPDFEDGVPPLHDNLLASGTPGVTYPVGLSVPSGDDFKKQREFLGTWAWNAPTAQFINSDAGTTEFFSTRQVTKTQKPGDKWFIESVDGVSFSRWRRIGQFEAGSVLQNRYIRRVTDVADPYGTLAGGDNKFPPTPTTFFSAKRNRFGQYLDDFLQGTDATFQYEDTPPDSRTNKAGLSTEESSMYDDFIADGVTSLDVDGIWEVTCIKDKYNRLESDFSTARYIPNNGDLVRYSANETPNINDLDQVDWTSNGWLSEFNPETHRYKAERSNTGEDFQIVLISSEIGTYTSRVFKAYPIRYFDVLTNAATRENYTPQGLGAAINSSDGIDSSFTWTDSQAQSQNAPNKGAWVDSHFNPPVGWNLWVSEAVFYFGGDKLKTPWATPTLFDNEAAVIDLIEGQEDFHSTPAVDDQGASTTTYDPATIDLTATLVQYDQRVTDQGQQYVINDDANETIKYKWERIFNNGSADNTIIFDNTAAADASELISDGDLSGGSYTYSPSSVDTYRIESDGRVLKIYPPGLDKRAIYKVTQERTTAGGTVSYIEETAGLLDVADGLASKVVVVTSDRPYFVLKGDAATSGSVWQYDDYINPVGSNHPEIVLRAFVQNVAAGKWYRWSSGETFDSVRTDVISGSTTKENTISGSYWTELSSTVTHVVAADDTEWDDDTINKQVVYKYQSGAFYDILRIERIQEGADIKDLDLRSTAQVVSLNGGETDFDPSSQVIEFRAVAQNITTAGINWEILDKTGADISDQITLYDQTSGGSPINDGDTVAYFRTADYPAANYRFTNLLANLPITVKVTHDDEADQIDFVTFRKISSGADGPAGIDALVGFLDNEAETQSCNESGVPINAAYASINGALQIRTNIVVFEGINDVTNNYQIGGATPANDITAVDENGATITKGTGSSNYNYTLSNGNKTITVTRLPEDKQKLIISLPIKRASDYASVVTRKLTISKALAGFTPLRMQLNNEFVVGKHQPDETVLDYTSSGLSGYGVIDTIKVTGYIGNTVQSITFNGNSADSIVGYPSETVDPFDSTWATPGTLGETTARAIRYTGGGNDIYFVLGDSGTIHVVSKIDTVGSDFDFAVAFQAGGQLDSKKISFRWLEQPADQYQVVVYSSDPVFHANEASTASTLVSARVVLKDGTETSSIPSGWSMEFSTGTSAPTQAGYTDTVKVTRAQVNISNQIIVKLKDADDNVVSVGSIVIYDLKDAPSFEELFYSSNSATFPSRPSGTYSGFPDSTNEQWGKTEDVNKTYLFVSRKSQYDSVWGWPIQIKGEQGLQGTFSVPVRVYKVSDNQPTASGGSVPSSPSDYTTFTPPSGWSKTPSYQGISRLWVAERQLEKNGDTWTWSGDWKISLLGTRESLSEVYVYRGASTATPSWYQDYDSPENQYPQSGSSNWKNSIADVGSTAYIFRAKGLYAAGTLQQRVVTDNAGIVELNAVTRVLVSGSQYTFRDANNSIITTGSTGNAYFFGGDLYLKQANSYWELSNSDRHYWAIPEQIYQQITGPTGPKGDKPDHQWSGTQLRFENPNGTWGSYVDLKGDDGDAGMAAMFSKNTTFSARSTGFLNNFDTGNSNSKKVGAIVTVRFSNPNSNEFTVGLYSSSSSISASADPPGAGAILLGSSVNIRPTDPSGTGYETTFIFPSSFLFPTYRYFHIRVTGSQSLITGIQAAVFETN